MTIHKIDYSKKDPKRANVINYSCNFNCKWCLYKIKTKPKSNYMEVNEIKHILNTMEINGVNFLGGEITTHPDLEELTYFTHEVLGVHTKIGHTNGYISPPKYIDEIVMSIKMFSDELHRKYTGKSNKPILKNFKNTHDKGIRIKASTLYIPDLVDSEEIEKIAKFIGDIDPEIRLHITGYIKIPGTPWRIPTYDEMINAKKLAENYLKNVDFSLYCSTNDYENKFSKNIV
ncbi:MAG: radical SAM protein [Methanobrevibacter sp.]|jgi:pyruvate formate lyase activating enzyme|nr:radical SAM protein [Candidatus Methanovirga basalitermitum]